MNESMDRLLSDWLHEGPQTGPHAGLERALAATRRVGQRPEWTLPERWIPMQLTMALTRSQRPVLALVLLAMLMVALVATALFIGSQRRAVPPPFGPARNGAVVWAADGDLFIADQLGGTPRSLVPGPRTDSEPVFSPQGDRVAFIRDGARILTVSPDGSDVHELAAPGTVVRLDWSPDGRALLASTFSLEDQQALKVVQGGGSGSRTLDLNGIYTVHGSWRPDGRYIAFVGEQAGRTATFIADANGTNVRPLGVGPDDSSDGLEWSPDGNHLGFLSPGGGISIADIAEDGALTDVRQLDLDLDLDPNATPAGDPKWSPDGSQLAFVQRRLPTGTETPAFGTGYTSQVRIANADGSGFRFVGPVGRVHVVTWSPDGRSLIIGSGGEAWSVDVATGEHAKVRTPVESWQRLAP